MAQKTAREIMSPDCTCVGERDTVLDAAERLAELNVGAMPICGQDQRLKGMVTDRDIVVRALAEGLPPRSTTLASIASHELMMIEQSAGVEEAVRAMRERDVRRLLVCDADRKLVGIISLSDLALLPTSAAA